MASKVNERRRSSGCEPWRIEQREKFKILQRDNFTCRYCGCRPGSENLEVDHVIPRARGGSDNACNLVAACVTCNRRKSDSIIFPGDMIEGDDREEGVKVHKSFGKWSVSFSDDTVFVAASWGWWFDAMWLVEDKGFVDNHLSHKYEYWRESEPYVAQDFLRCVGYIEQMIAPRSRR